MDKTSRKGRRQALRALLRSLLTAALLVTTYYVLPLDSAFTAGTVLALVGGVAAVVLLLVWHIRRIAQSPRPELRAAEALGTTLPLYLLLFATVYYLMERSGAESFSEVLSRSDALYFTMTVFSTVGFGDISPRSEPARLLVTAQMTLNLLLIGVAARFLVAAVKKAKMQSGR
ncbi:MULTISPECIES: potassium channel family protein [unclassified Streptomyces]|uniref:potassium channel family protein n=1 Tax=unclassified Streptomyces TaxID=2593676 RepID=UPI002250C51A|nr:MULTISPECIES: potassium channel family protein [unclassified Streptomyces]MCX5057132.1 ion channel [Streptomyces sp. NBC_00452]